MEEIFKAIILQKEESKWTQGSTLSIGEMTIAVNCDKKWIYYLTVRVTTKNDKEMHSKRLKVNQNGIQKNNQGTQEKAGEKNRDRKTKRTKRKQK